MLGLLFRKLVFLASQIHLNLYQVIKGLMGFLYKIILVGPQGGSITGISISHCIC
jgi:hypothetical protein